MNDDQAVVLGPRAELPIRSWMFLLVIAAGAVVLYFGWRSNLLLIAGAIVGMILLICIVINFMFWMERRKGNYLRYIRESGIVELPRRNEKIESAQIDHLQVLNGMRPMAGSTLNSISWSEMNLVIAAGGDQRRYPIISSSHQSSVNSYAEKLAKVIAVPVKKHETDEVEARR